MTGIRSMHRFTFPEANTINGYTTSVDTKVAKIHHPKPVHQPTNRRSSSQTPSLVCGKCQKIKANKQCTNKWCKPCCAADLDNSCKVTAHKKAKQQEKEKGKEKEADTGEAEKEEDEEEREGEETDEDVEGGLFDGAEVVAAMDEDEGEMAILGVE
jgi:uncharacterized CHY-type Zn-finger protein